MTILDIIADVLLNSMIIAVAGYAAWLAIRYLWRTHDHTPEPPGDPVDPAYWDVLADTRRILESE